MTEENHGESMWRRPVTELSSYPTELDAHVTLTDQRRIRIRALHRREERPIRVLHARLSPRTRYLRFLSPIPTLPDALVRRLACVDYRRRLAVVAEDEGAACADVVALASFSAVDETTAELAVVVQDDWQRQGIGTALVSTLLDAAEKRGFDRFVATIATDNSIIRRLLDRFGRVVGSHTSLGASELVFVRGSSWGNAAPGSAVGGEWPVAPQRRRTTRRCGDQAGPNPYGRQGTRTRFAANGLTTMVEGRSR